VPRITKRYSIADLARLADVTVRTIRYYQTEGLLDAPGTPGPGPKYDDRDLARLRLIRRLQREHLPLAEIRRRLEQLPDEAIETLMAQRAEPEVAPADSALDYIRRVLEPRRGVAEARAPFVRSLARRLSVAAPEPPLAAAPPTTPEPRLPERSQWERITLATDVELHVRRPLPRPLAKQVDRLVSIARDLLEEDPS
jgi:DNA-binding transcriptional MerR regulator